MTRRVPVCSINWCCPYRSDLCTSTCTGKRKPKDGFMIVDGDHCFIRQGDYYLRYLMPYETKQLLIRSDRGEPDATLEGRYTFEPPKA
jgi:hypothetical protein